MAVGMCGLDCLFVPEAFWTRCVQSLRILKLVPLSFHGVAISQDSPLQHRAVYVFPRGRSR